jgi:hypothetical protein
MFPVPAGKETMEGVEPVPLNPGAAIGSVEVTVVPSSDTAELPIEVLEVAFGIAFVVSPEIPPVPGQLRTPAVVVQVVPSGFTPPNTEVVA